MTIDEYINNVDEQFQTIIQSATLHDLERIRITHELIADEINEKEWQLRDDLIEGEQ